MAFSASALENTNGANPKTEAQILDEMADSWIETCKKNSVLCGDGRQVYCVVKDQYGNSVTTDAVTLQAK